MLYRCLSIYVLQRQIPLSWNVWMFSMCFCLCYVRCWCEHLTLLLAAPFIWHNKENRYRRNTLHTSNTIALYKLNSRIISFLEWDKLHYQLNTMEKSIEKICMNLLICLNGKISVKFNNTVIEIVTEKWRQNVHCQIKQRRREKITTNNNNNHIECYLLYRFLLLLLFFFISYDCSIEVSVWRAHCHVSYTYI